MRFRRLAVVVAWPLGAAALHAQSAKDHIALGDRDYAERHVPAAIAHFEAAIAADPKNYDALCKASRAEADFGEGLPKGPVQDKAYAASQRYAEQAIAVNPHHADGHFALSRALGRRAMSVGTMERIHFSKIIRTEALESLKYDSLHVGALHVMGSWNAEVMRLNTVQRSFAKTFLGGEVFALASWTEAIRYLEKAVAVDPTRLGHHMDLGAVYMDAGFPAKARQQFEWVAKAPLKDPNDALYKQRAADRLRRL